MELCQNCKSNIQQKNAILLLHGFSLILWDSQKWKKVFGFITIVRLVWSFGYRCWMVCLCSCDSSFTCKNWFHLGAYCNIDGRELGGDLLGLWVTASNSVPCTCFQVWLVWSYNKSECPETWMQVLMVETVARPLLCLCPRHVHGLCYMYVDRDFVIFFSFQLYRKF